MRWTLTVERKLEHHEVSVQDFRAGSVTIEEDFYTGEDADVMVLYWYMIDDPQYMMFYNLSYEASLVGDRRRFIGKKIRVKYGRQVLHECVPV